MKKINCNRFQGILTNQKGVSAIMVAILLPVLIGFAALAIDVGYMYATKGELQNVADGSALAGASELGRIYLEIPKHQQHAYELTTQDEAQIRDTVKLVAIENAAAGISIEIQDSDIYIGRWDFDQPDPELRWNEPYYDPTDPDNQRLSPAVRVDARRDSFLNNPVSTFFARIFGGAFDAFQVSARATAALSGIPSIAEGVMNAPFAVSRNHSCNNPIEFHPSPSSCAGWHVYFDSPSNANTLSNNMYGYIKDHPDGTNWLSSHAGNVNNNLSAKTPPEVAVGDFLTFTGGTLASLFNGFYYSDWTDKDTPDTTSEQGTGNTYAPFLALFDFFKFRDGDDIDEDGNPVTSIQVCNDADGNARFYHPNEIWSTFVPVYHEEPGDGCLNPNQTLEVVSYAYVQIIQPNPPPDKTIEVCMRCSAIDEDLGRGGGGIGGFIIGSIPNLVQ